MVMVVAMAAVAAAALTTLAAAAVTESRRSWRAFWQARRHCEGALRGKRAKTWGSSLASVYYPSWEVLEVAIYTLLLARKHMPILDSEPRTGP